MDKGMKDSYTVRLNNGPLVKGPPFPTYEALKGDKCEHGKRIGACSECYKKELKEKGVSS